MEKHLLLRLAGRALRYRYLKATGRAARPEALSIEVTRRCIARCVMCNIWKTPGDLRELTVTEWLTVLSSPVLSELKELDVTGGEPFLRDDLKDLFLGVIDLKASRLPRLRTIAVTTNGFLTDRVLDTVRDIVAPLEQAGMTLVFACGMDGVGEVHDRIRNFPGGGAKLHATIEGLARLRERHPCLVPGIKTTVTRHNIDELEKISRYADEQGLFTIISPYILTANRYANSEKEEQLALSPGDNEKLTCFYRSGQFRWSSYQSELVRFLETGRMEKPCSAGFNYFFVRSSGELFPCPIIDYPLGNVTQAPLDELIASPEAACFRKNVNGYPECATCTEPGLERYSLPFEGLYYLRLYFSLGKERFVALHEHLGLNKYFVSETVSQPSIKSGGPS
jgi:MoaA/NifB/PqqE/SkfB family radical SAM enzyme